MNKISIAVAVILAGLLPETVSAESWLEQFEEDTHYYMTFGSAWN